MNRYMHQYFSNYLVVGGNMYQKLFIRPSLFIQHGYALENKAFKLQNNERNAAVV